MSASALRIVVAGYLVRGPYGGLAWHNLHYLTGLRALGHDVWFFVLEPLLAAAFDKEGKQASGAKRF